MKKVLSIFLIVCIVLYAIIFINEFILGGAGDGSALFSKEIKDIGNGTYFEITADELKEYPEIMKTIRGGEGCTQLENGEIGWYCELKSDEANKMFEFFNIKHSEYLFSIDMKFENNLNNNIIDAELVNTFHSKGFPLSENYSTVSIPSSVYNYLYDSWFLNKDVNTPEYTIRKIKDDLKVYKSGGYIEYKFAKIGDHFYEITLAIV